MNAKTLAVLEYDKIKEMLMAEAGCEASRKMASELAPLTEVRDIQYELRSTSEAVDLIVRKGPLPTGGLYEIDRQLHMTRKGGSLTMGELLQVHYDLRITGQVVTFMKSEELPALPLIRSMTELLVPLPELAAEIDRCILSEDEMADNASPALRDIRRSIARQNEAVRNRLSKIISSAENRPYLQDALVTQRNGRYVIPVKQEHRSRVPGLIHDQSKGGQTLFIEPQAVVELNNELRELELKEQQEIARILAELSDRVAERFHEIRSNLRLLKRLDFLMAKGKLSRRMHAEEPHLEAGEPGQGEAVLNLIAARHPLLDPHKAVPIDVRLGGNYHSLIITGPNTGGKTVSLKTTGLLALMAQSGLHIPASSESTLPVFREVYADIGDEQSIEQSLSTFSSHMKNLVGIIAAADEQSLVLLDELGAGTDPTEGAALAIAILEKLSAAGAMIMATTHYNELKKYALSSPDVENAAMEFDVETLSPTYHLLTGIPGKSNAFEISRKLGLDHTVIDRASDLIEGRDLEFENVIAAIEDDKKAAEAERLEAARMTEEIRKKLEMVETRERELAEKREKELEKAREEAREILREARETARDVQKELKELAKGGIDPDRNRRLEKNRERLRELEKKNASRTVRQVSSEPVAAEDLAIGDRVKVMHIGQNGEVISLPDEKGNLQVAIGAMRVNVKLADLMLINEGKDRKPPAKATAHVGSLGMSKARTVSPEINVQGENLEDALMDVEKYLDDVYIAGLERVTVIHGRGEGILKNGIRRMLKSNKYVKSFAAGRYDEGGEGVTIVTMKK
ncbi:MAG: endonuclease MutS2 [Firmicutes bacterium]|nr:endonuclease MutS2 [Bacillota bacterium]